MQELFGVVVVWSVLMTGVSFFCLIRLGVTGVRSGIWWRSFR